MKRVEVFRTNVNHPDEAGKLVRLIRGLGFEATFDLEDCDRVMRVTGTIPDDVPVLIDLLGDSGYIAEIMPD